MARINITGQSTAANQFKTALTKFITQLDKRREVWDRLTPEQRKRWMDSGKDQVLAKAKELYDELRGWFDA